MIHFCFIFTSMSDTILSDCPLSAICHTATTGNRILVERFNLYVMGQYNKTECTAFGAAVANEKKEDTEKKTVAYRMSVTFMRVIAHD